MSPQSPSQKVACVSISITLLACLLHDSKATMEQPRLIWEAKDSSDGSLNIMEGKQAFCDPFLTDISAQKPPEFMHPARQADEGLPGRQTAPHPHRLYQSQSPASDSPRRAVLRPVLCSPAETLAEAPKHSHSPSLYPSFPSCIHSPSHTSGLENEISHAPYYSKLRPVMWTQDSECEGAEQNRSSPRELNLFPKDPSLDFTRSLPNQEALEGCNIGKLMPNHDHLTELKLYSETHPEMYLDFKTHSGDRFGTNRNEKQLEATFYFSTPPATTPSILTPGEGEMNPQTSRADLFAGMDIVKVDQMYPYDGSHLTSPTHIESKKSAFDHVGENLLRPIEAEEKEAKKRKKCFDVSSKVQKGNKGTSSGMYNGNSQVYPKFTKDETLRANSHPTVLQPKEYKRTRDVFYNRQSLSSEALPSPFLDSVANIKSILEAMGDGWEFIKLNLSEHKVKKVGKNEKEIQDLSSFFHELRSVTRCGGSENEFRINEDEAIDFINSYYLHSRKLRKQKSSKGAASGINHDDSKYLYTRYLVAVSDKVFSGLISSHNFKKFIWNLQKRMLKNIPYSSLSEFGREKAWTLIESHAEYVKELIGFSAIRIRMVLEFFHKHDLDKTTLDEFFDAYKLILDIMTELESESPEPSEFEWLDMLRKSIQRVNHPLVYLKKGWSYKTRETVQNSWRIVAYWLHQKWPSLSESICKSTTGAIREDWIGFFNEILIHANHNVDPKRFYKGFKPLSLGDSLTIRGKNLNKLYK